MSDADTIHYIIEHEWRFYDEWTEPITDDVVTDDGWFSDEDAARTVVHEHEAEMLSSINARSKEHYDRLADVPEKVLARESASTWSVESLHKNGSVS